MLIRPASTQRVDGVERRRVLLGKLGDVRVVCVQGVVK
jgi:hypothetical protein